MLVHNKTIFWDYIKNTKDMMKQLQNNINTINAPESLKSELFKECDKVSYELASMRIILTNTQETPLAEWEQHKKQISDIQAHIHDKIKDTILKNHAPNVL